MGERFVQKSFFLMAARAGRALFQTFLAGPKTSSDIKCMVRAFFVDLFVRKEDVLRTLQALLPRIRGFKAFLHFKKLRTLNSDKNSRQKSNICKHTAVDDQTKIFSVMPLWGRSNLYGRPLTKTRGGNKNRLLYTSVVIRFFMVFWYSKRTFGK